MKQKLTRNPKIAFYLDETALQRIIEIIESFQKVEDFDVELSDGSKITCDTLDEVLRISNVKPREIIGLYVWTGITGDLRLHLHFDKPRHVVGEALPPIYYSIEGEEKEVLFFASKLEEGLAQLKLWYNAIVFRSLGMMVVSSLAIVAFTISTGYWLLSKLDVVPAVQQKGFSEQLELIVYIGLIGIAFVWIISWLQVKLFPAAVFAIGDGIHRYEQIKTIRRVVFGTILGSIGLAVISAVVINLLGL